MDWSDLEKHFSAARLGRYRASCNGDVARAAKAYVNNMLLAEATMPMLNVLEIALKNGVHQRLITLYKRSDWWDSWVSDPSFAWQVREVVSAKAKLQRRAEALTPDKIIAELPFGFWSSLFNVQFQTILWKTCGCFSRAARSHSVSAILSRRALNQIRELRNRVFHHEQLLWLSPSLIDLHGKAIEVVAWIDPKLPPWLASYDRLPTTWAAIQPIQVNHSGISRPVP